MYRLLTLLLLAAPVWGADLFRDDFSKFPPGWLSRPMGQLNAAIQEYHYVARRGVDTGPWANPIVHLDAWVVGEEDGRAFLEQHLMVDRPQWFNALMITGDEEWSGYTLEARVKPLSHGDVAGIVFRYETNRNFIVFGLRGGNEAVLRRRLPIEQEYRVSAWKELGAVKFDHDVRRYYHLKVENDGARIRAYIDGKLVIEAKETANPKGKAGVTANMPTRFMDFHVHAPAAEVAAIRTRMARREEELARLRAGNPKPVLWKKFATPGFGAGRNVRFGDLDGDGQVDMLFAQNLPRVRGDAFDHIQCLTAVDLNGKVLWQQGKPNESLGLLTNDTPFQIHDVDGDGKHEVVLIQDFQLKVLDGKTGHLLRSTWMPPMAADLKERPYELNSGDAIAFLDLSGKGRRSEILVKDRYRYFWIYDEKLKLLWSGEGQTGHYPYPMDVDGDGREEFALGYTLWSPEGKPLFSRDKDFRDHADGISVGNYGADPKQAPLVYACGSDEGFLLFDLKGNVLKHLRIGHAQSPSVGKYRADVDGVQLMTINYWRNPGIVSLFDWKGNLLKQGEPVHSGSPLLPVNWRGDGTEFAMLSGNVREGGMIDGELRRVVMFPDDGHPDLAFAVLDLTGDPRDEIVLWDQKQVWISTQDRPFNGKRIYAPVRNPEYNESNYRTTVSLPGWREHKP
jgi:rhamnogalacturonan endolyase